MRRILGLVLALAACTPGASSPPAAEPSPAREGVAAVLDAMMIAKCTDVVEKPGLQAYVSEVARRLLHDHEGPRPERWTFRVISDHTLDAYSLPDGFVYITLGLFIRLEDEAELASVIGHEMAHVVAGLEAGRGAHAMGDDAHALVEEMEADAVAVKWLTRSGYDPGALVRVLERMLPLRGGPQSDPDLLARIRNARRTTKPHAGGDQAPRAPLAAVQDGLVVSERGPSFGAPAEWGAIPWRDTPCEPFTFVSPRGDVVTFSRMQPEREPADAPSAEAIPMDHGFWVEIRDVPLESKSAAIAEVTSPTGNKRYFTYVTRRGAAREALGAWLREALHFAPMSQRLRMVTSLDGETLRDVIARACPDAPAELVASMTGLALDAVVRADHAVRCIERF